MSINAFQYYLSQEDEDIENILCSFLFMFGFLFAGLVEEFCRIHYFCHDIPKMILEPDYTVSKHSRLGLFSPVMWSAFATTISTEAKEDPWKTFLWFSRSFLWFSIPFLFLGAILEIQYKLTTTYKIIILLRRYKVATLKNVLKAIFAPQGSGIRVTKFYFSDRVYDFFEEDSGDWKVEVKLAERQNDNGIFSFFKW